MKATPKAKGTRKAMLARQALRLAGKLNAPIRGARGLAKLAEELRRRWGGPYPPRELL